MWNFFVTVGSLIVFVVLFIFYKIVIRPYIGLLEYKRQGVGIIFHKELANVEHGNKNAMEKGDFNYHYKEFLKQNPNATCVAENFFGSAMLSILDADMMKQFLQNSDMYHKDIEISGSFRNLVIGSSLFMEGPEWKERRRLQSPSFHFDFLKNLIPMIVEVADSMYGKLLKEKDFKKVDIQSLLSMNTGDLLGRFSVGKKYTTKRVMGLPMTMLLDKVLASSAELSFGLPTLLFGHDITKKNIFPSHRKHNEMVQALFKGVEEMIVETDQSVDEEFNFMSNILKMRKENPENYVSNADLVSEFIVLFGAGVSTTTISLTSIIYLLSKHPECIPKLKEEADRELSDLSNVTYDGLTRMTYTAAVIKEGLRLMGPTNPVVFRVATKDHKLGGVKVKKGAKINGMVGILHRSEKYFPDADQFVPERWLPESPYAKDGYKIDPFAFLPFSGGPRNCIGQHVSMFQMKIFIGLLVRTFDYKINEDFNPNMILGLDMEFHDTLLLDLTPKDQTKA